MRARTSPEPTATQATLRHRLPVMAIATADATRRNPTNPLAPEQAEAIWTWNPSAPCGIRNEIPSPATASARGTTPTTPRTAMAVRSARCSSRTVTRNRNGMGQASSRSSTAALVRHRTRMPNSRATTPATNRGMVSRSIRHSQYIVDIRAGSRMSATRAATTSGTPTMRSM